MDCDNSTLLFQHAINIMIDMLLTKYFNDINIAVSISVWFEVLSSNVSFSF